MQECVFYRNLDWHTPFFGNQLVIGRLIWRIGGKDVSIKICFLGSSLLAICPCIFSLPLRWAGLTGNLHWKQDMSSAFHAFCLQNSCLSAGQWQEKSVLTRWTDGTNVLDKNSFRVGLCSSGSNPMVCIPGIWISLALQSETQNSLIIHMKYQKKLKIAGFVWFF